MWRAAEAADLSLPGPCTWKSMSATLVTEAGTAGGRRLPLTLTIPDACAPDVTLPFGPPPFPVLLLYSGFMVSGVVRVRVSVHAGAGGCQARMQGLVPPSRMDGRRPQPLPGPEQPLPGSVRHTRVGQPLLAPASTLLSSASVQAGQPLSHKGLPCSALYSPLRLLSRLPPAPCPPPPPPDPSEQGQLVLAASAACSQLGRGRDPVRPALPRWG